MLIWVEKQKSSVVVTMLCPNVSLNTGQQMPVIGLGTSKSSGEVVEKTVREALEAGYRHLDCAYVYGNEREIGNAIRNHIQRGIIQRKDLFISSKLGCSFGQTNQVQAAYQRTLTNLQLEYLDLFYIHWPFTLKYSGPDNFFPCDDQSNPLFDENTDYIETWQEMEKLYKSGKVKAIGLCNFNICQLERLLEECSVIPAVHQFECHPYLGQEELVKFCQMKNISVTGYSPLCSMDRTNLPAGISLFQENTLQSLANKYKKSVAQIVLRYQTQRGIAVIPRSTNKSRMNENINLFGFKLCNDDLLLIKKLDKGVRIMYPDKFSTHKHFPFN